MSYTKGPWEIDTATRPAEVCTVYHVPTQMTEDGEGQNFVYVRGAIGYWDADQNEQMANAKLISAAPELLEALERICAYPDIDKYAGSIVYNACLEAIAKAKT